MNQTAFSNWTEISRLNSIEYTIAEDAVLATVDDDKLAEILEEDGGLRVIEGVRFTPGGNFVLAIAGNGRAIETAIELVS